MGKQQTMVNGDIITAPGDFQECLRGLSFNYDRLYEQAQFFNNELLRMRDEKWRDEELQKLNAENEQLHQQLQHGFYVRPEEQELINNWMQNHASDVHHCTGQGGVCGGMFSYLFTPTSVGTVGRIRCNLCREVFTFSDI